MAQRYTEAQKQSARKWDAANLDRLSIALPKGSRETIKAHATAHSESVNGFIGRAISETMERDGAERPQETAGAGQVSLPPEALAVACAAAERTGEAVGVFLTRAAQTQAKRDELSLRTGLNQATGEKL